MSLRFVDGYVSVRCHDWKISKMIPRWKAAVLAALMSVQQVPFTHQSDSFAAQPTPTVQSHYTLVMSADDATCKPLLGLYNKMLSNAIKALKSQTATSTLYIPITSDFEVTQPGSFYDAGFRMPPLEVGSPSQGVYRADIFNDGITRSVLVVDQARGQYFSTLVKVIKQGIDRAQLSKLVGAYNRPPTEAVPFELFENINAGLTDPDRAEGAKYGLRGLYILRKWPHVDNAIKQWRLTQNGLPPVLVDPTSIRVLSGQGKTFFIADEYAFDIHSPGPESIVVVYVLRPAGPVDICYLYMH